MKSFREFINLLESNAEQLEENLRAIVSEIVKNKPNGVKGTFIKNISISDSFFELGGDSLTAINLCAKIYSELNVQIFVKDVLENPIIKDLSDVISSKDLHNKNCPLKKAEIKDI